MTRMLLTAAFATLAAFAASPAHAAFDVTYQQGSRDDVRAWCAVEPGVLSDREDYTMCVSTIVPATTLTCDDAGQCIRTGYDLTTTGSVRAPGGKISPAEARDSLPTSFPEKEIIMIPSGNIYRELPINYGGTR